MAKTPIKLLLLLPPFLFLTIFYLSFFNQIHFNNILFPKYLPNINNNQSNPLISNINHHYRGNISFISKILILKEKKEKKNNDDNNNGSLEKIENGLARARAAIRIAARRQSYKLEGDEIFIPRGQVYRNPYAFHQLSFII
ncbi:unnamed protein product [Amaranthus hypochondriacus]